MQLPKVPFAKVQLAEVQHATVQLAKVHLATVQFAKVQFAKVQLAKIHLATVQLAIKCISPQCNSLKCISPECNSPECISLRLKFCLNKRISQKTPLRVHCTLYSTACTSCCEDVIIPPLTRGRFFFITDNTSSTEEKFCDNISSKLLEMDGNCVIIPSLWKENVW